MINIFTNSKLRLQRSQFRQLVAIAKLDGFLHDNEIRFLDHFGQKIGLSREDVEDLIEISEPSELLLPHELRSKYDYLYEIVAMGLADDQITESELDFCNEMAKKLDFKPEVAGVIVRRMAMEMKNSHTRESIFYNLKPFLVL